MKKILILIIILNSGYSNSQEMNDFEKESRIKADLVFEKTAKSQSENLPYLLLSSGNINYLIIIDKKTFYTQITAFLNPKQSVEIKAVKTIKKPNEILEKAFNKSLYHKGFIGFESEFFKNGYEIASGTTTYFVMKDSERNRFGESSLSFFIKPNPIDVEIYNYLTNKMLEE